MLIMLSGAAAAVLTKPVVDPKHELRQRVERFYSRFLVVIEEEMKIGEGEGFHFALQVLEVSYIQGMPVMGRLDSLLFPGLSLNNW